MKNLMVVSKPRVRYPDARRGLNAGKALLAAALALGGLFAAPTQAWAADPPTDAQVAAVIKGGQQYLFNQFHDNGDGTGYWSDYDNLTGTVTAVAALIESGKYADAAYKPLIDKGIAFIKTMVKTDGGIYQTSYSATYQTGLALVALGLYGQADRKSVV